MTSPRSSRSRLVAAAAFLAASSLLVAPTAQATTGQSAGPPPTSGRGSEHRSGGAHTGSHGTAGRLAPRTHFTMKPDGSSGLRPDGEGIPNIDSVKKTIRTYYGDTGAGIADKVGSPYITEMSRIVARQERALRLQYRHEIGQGDKPALVFDTDDTTLWTYDMEAGAMNFVYDPAVQDQWVQGEKFPATPGMVRLVNDAARMGYTIFGLTGRNDDQKAATLDNLRKVGFTAFTANRFFTKWTGKGDSQQPSYIRCAATSCTTVEYKALTRRHIEKLGYDIVANFGDQYSDLQGGYADRAVKLPNPTYYLPSPNLPGVQQPWLAPRTHFAMKPDGSSGLRADGDGIPNIDSVKSTIRTYYGDDGDGIADRTSSPYITELSRITRQQTKIVTAGCRRAAAHGQNPAIVLDADDTTLWTYDMEAGAMSFVFDPALQDEWVQGERFPATPGMVDLVNAAYRAGCTLIGLTGRNDDQKAATIGNLINVGYDGFTKENYYTKWTGDADSQQPAYIHCAVASCTTIEYKSQTRAHVESAGGGDHRIVANFGDQYSDLIGGHADRVIKLPNPTYYLP